jgi:hypothetical protein
MAQEHVKTADELELEIITLLKHPPIALTISKRDVDRYAWHWLGASGEGDSFPNALENALAHIATTYLAFITPYAYSPFPFSVHVPGLKCLDIH